MQAAKEPPSCFPSQIDRLLGLQDKKGKLLKNHRHDLCLR